MDAILLVEENIDKILEVQTENWPDRAILEIYANLSRPWYFISGYYTSTRYRPRDWTIFPEYLFQKKFQHDPEAVKTGWDLIFPIDSSENLIPRSHSGGVLE